jgi:hypothetical protein
MLNDDPRLSFGLKEFSSSKAVEVVGRLLLKSPSYSSNSSSGTYLSEKEQFSQQDDELIY